MQFGRNEALPKTRLRAKRQGRLGWQCWPIPISRHDILRSMKWKRRSFFASLDVSFARFSRRKQQAIIQKDSYTIAKSKAREDDTWHGQKYNTFVYFLCLVAVLSYLIRLPCLFCITSMSISVHLVSRRSLNGRHKTRQGKGKEEARKEETRQLAASAKLGFEVKFRVTPYTLTLT